MIRNFDFTIQTKGFSDIIDITDRINKLISDSGFQNGLATTFISGATASITTIEYEPGLINDLKNALERLFSQNIYYEHNSRWGDGNGFSHIRAAFLGPSLSIPFQNMRLLLGTWQQIILIDHDNRSRNRTVLVQLIGE